MSRLPKRVWLLGWVSLFADIASEMVYPVIPIFVTAVVGAPVAALGAIEGFAEAIVSFMKGWSGWHSDRSGKRTPYIRWGYGLSAIGKPLLAFASTWLLVFGARSADRFGKGLRTTARDALLADSVTKQDYGRAFGLHRAMDTTGAFVGGVLALILLELLVTVPEDLRRIFLIAAVPGALSVLLTFIIRESTKSENRDEAQRFRLSDWPQGYWRAVGITLLFGVANSSDTFLLLRANQVFQEQVRADPSSFALVGDLLGRNSLAFGLPLILTTLAYLLYNLTYIACSYPAGVVSDRIGRWPVLATGFLLYAGVYLGFGFATSAWIWVLFALYGIYNGLTGGVSKALVADHAPKEAKGTALGIFYMASGFMTLGGNVITGVLWDRIGPRAAFVFGASTALIAVLMIPLSGFILRHSSRGTTSPS